MRSSFADISIFVLLFGFGIGCCDRGGNGRGGVGFDTLAFLKLFVEAFSKKDVLDTSRDLGTHPCIPM